MNQPSNGRFEAPAKQNWFALAGKIVVAILAAIGLAFLIKRLRRRVSGTPRERGIGLLETLAAVAIMGFIGVAFMAALTSAYKSLGITEEQQTAETLVRSQIEIIKNASYSDNASYPVSVSLPPQYSMVIGVTAPTQIGTLEDNVPLEQLVGGPVTTIQEITISVYHGNDLILAVGAYKVKP